MSEIVSSDADVATIPRRELVTLLAYLETGSHKAAAHRLGISQSTSRQRLSSLMGRVGVRNAAQAAWTLRRMLETEAGTGDPSPEG
jgi:DNA-binding NarL/FixJ family response regulator